MIGAQCFILEQLCGLLAIPACFFGRVNLLGQGILARIFRNGRIVTSSRIQGSSFIFPGAFSNNHLRMTLVAKQKASNLQFMFPYRERQSAMPVLCITNARSTNVAAEVVIVSVVISALPYRTYD